MARFQYTVYIRARQTMGGGMTVDTVAGSEIEARGHDFDYRQHEIVRLDHDDIAKILAVSAGESR